MLRGIVLAFTMAFVALSLAGVIAERTTWPTLIVALVLLAGVAFERQRYGAVRAAAPAGADWQPTPERFFDENGQRVRVWVDAKTGERRYVADETAPE